MKHKFYVIGGQHESYCYGGKDTLLAAKRLAGQNDEYWDNWQGWNRPVIYKAEDVEIVKNFYGTQIAPKELARPVAVYRNGKWATV